jgi:S-adenosylmethionine hydrolase
VHLAVVDPGVGTERRAIAITTTRGDVLVGPDNGLLLPSAEALGGIASAFELSDPRYRLEAVSATFHGRDLFAPAAAHVAVGVDPSRLGPPVDELVAAAPPFVRSARGLVEADVLRFDHFGNIRLAASGLGLSGDVEVVCDAGRFEARVGRTFADVEAGALLVYVDSSGFTALACRGGSARELLQSPERVTVRAKT